MNTFTLTLPIDRVPNSNNARVHWATLAAKRREMRAAAKTAAKDVQHYTGPVHLDVVMQFPDRRARDLDNPELKAAIDGMVDAGVITDDNSKQLVAITRRASPTTSPKGYVVLTFTLHTQVVPF